MNKKTEKNPKGAGRMRITSPKEEELIYQRHRRGFLTYEILYEFKISERTYSRILDRVYAALQKNQPHSD